MWVVLRKDGRYGYRHLTMLHTILIVWK